MSGMITFESSSPRALKWQNSSDTNGWQPATLGAQMQYLRYGDKSVLVAWGGFDTKYLHPEDGHWITRAMAQLLVYDIGSEKWYNVTATGQIPNTRDEMCSVVSYAADGSSANILLYGGWSLLDGRGWQDIYVLSVPSFQWILVNASGHADAKGQEIGHGNMRCHLHGERNMVVVGGTWNQANHEVNDVACNPSYPSVRALDTSSMTWYKTWPGASNAKYEVPQAVYNVIGGK
jgi:hypothetical protein